MVAVKWGGQPELEIRLAVMVGEFIYANVRLRLTANLAYEQDVPLYIITKMKNSASQK